MDFINDDRLLIYRNIKRRRIMGLILLLVVVLLLFIIGIGIGTTYIPFIDVIKAIFNCGDTDTIFIVRNIRLPRALAALIAGGGLAISGCIMQNVLKNEMASPSTLGVGNAAVFGANVAIIGLGAGSFGASNGFINLNNPYVVTVFAFVFAILSVFLILFLARIKHFTSESIVLAGVAIGTIFNAGTLILQFFSEEGELASAVFWTFGDLSRANYKECLIMFIIIFVSLLFFIIKGFDYNAIANGRGFAKTLGVKVERTSIISLLLASLITAVCVSFLGIIGFVGLIAPQIMKRFVRDDFRYLIPSSFLFGSALLLLSDLVSRLIIQGTPLPVGAITSLLGGPMFIYLLIRGRKD